MLQLDKNRRCTIKYLGVDFHKKYSTVTMVDEKGSVLDRRRLYNRREDFAKFLKTYSEISAVVEACRNWPVVVDLLDDLVDEVTLVHPYKVKAIAEAKIKTDSIDSLALAQLLRGDLIPEAYLRDKENQKKQRVLRSRSFYVKLRTQVKNRIHSQVDIQEETIREIAKGLSDLFGKKGLLWLKGLDVQDPDSKLLKTLLRIYDEISEKIKERDWLVRKIMLEDKDCQLLKTVPGLGAFLAVLVKVEIGDINRFSTSSHLCSYSELVPSTCSSGGRS